MGVNGKIWINPDLKKRQEYRHIPGVLPVGGVDGYHHSEQNSEPVNDTAPIAMQEPSVEKEPVQEENVELHSEQKVMFRMIIILLIILLLFNKIK